MDAASNLTRTLRRSFALHATARALESVAVGWLAGCTVIAVDAFTASSAHAPNSSGVAPIAWVAVLVGVCAAGALWLERAPRLASHTRRVDGRLGFDGALVTAAEAPVGTSSLARALVERVTQRLNRSDLARASLPATPIAVIAIVAGIAALYAARDLAPARPTDANTAESFARAAASSAAGDLRRAAGRHAVVAPAGANSRGSVGESADARAAELLAERLERFARDGADAEERARLAADVRAAAVDPRQDPEVAQGLAVARDALSRIDSGASDHGTRGSPSDSTAHDARSASNRTSTAGSTSTGSTSNPGDSRASTGSDAPTNATGGDRSLASVAGDGRMSTPRTDGNPPATNAAASSSVERGVSTLRWWPTEDDAVVQRWVDSRRER